MFRDPFNPTFLYTNANSARRPLNRFKAYKANPFGIDCMRTAAAKPFFR